MQKTIFIGMLSLISVFLSACNLGASAIEEPTQVILQPTEIIVTREDPTERPTNTPLPTQEVVIPDNACTPRSDWSAYSVVAGDTLSRIAVRGSTTVDTLVSGNCLSNANLISPGQVLRVPFAVVAPSPVVITSTPVPQTTTACRITMTGQRYSYYDQTYLSFARLVNSGETYIITGHNTWNYRIQLTASQDGWLQKSIPEQPVGDCGNVPEVGLFYHEMGGTNDNICYFIPDGSDFNVYLDQASTNQAFTLSGAHYYMVDAQAYNQYRIVSGQDLAYPAWAQSGGGILQGNCANIPDVSIATTLGAANANFSNSAYPFTFEYPSNLPITHMSDGVGGFRFGTMPLFSGYPTVIGFPDDIYIVTVTFANAPADATPLSHAEDIVQNIRDNPSRVGVIEDPSDVTLASGLETVHFSLSVPNSPTENYIFAIGEQMFHLTIQANQTYAEHLLETLRSTE